MSSGHLIGYARTSTVEQEAGLEAQQRELEALGCKRVYAEQISGAIPAGQRPKLREALDYLRDGDTLVVTKADRLARSTLDLLSLVRDLEAHRVGLRILSMGGGLRGLDTTDATDKLMLTVLAAVAEFERDIMRERQMEGIRKAQKEGRYKGRKPTARAKAGEAAELFKAGKSVSEVAKALGIGRGSVYRALEAAGLRPSSSKQ